MMIFLPCAHMGSLHCVIKIVFKEAMLDLGWGPRYPQCHGRSCSNVMKSQKRQQTMLIKCIGLFLILYLWWLIDVFVGTGAFKVAFLIWPGSQDNHSGIDGCISL